MSRIAEVFKKKKPYIGYLTAGDGGIKRTLEAAHALVAGGVDLLEVGIPFTDPIADGPVIQEAMERALKEGTTPDDVLEFVADFRKTSEVPIVLFSYYNPILKKGRPFLKKAKELGADGILIVDLSIEEGKTFREDCPLDTILLVAPSTPIERVKKIAAASSGFLYYVSRKGTTGAKSDLPEDLEEKVKQMKQQTSLPVVVGFGISNREMTQKIVAIADGFVVGSYLVEAIGSGKSIEELTEITRGLAP